jgi:Zn-finger nucleic acid-binding protein
MFPMGDIAYPWGAKMNCPTCGAAIEVAGNRRSFHCSYCNNFHFPEETGDGVSVLGDPVGVDCPVCKLDLETAEIEGEVVGYCPRCRGFLTATANFGRIVEKRRALHGPHEANHEPFDPAELKRVLQCPVCHLCMEAHPYYGGGNAVVDTCDRCSYIWLDAGELAIIERYIPHARPAAPVALTAIAVDEPREQPPDLVESVFDLLG